MTKRRALVIVTFLFIFTTGSIAADAQDWKKLGSKNVDLRSDRDTIIASEHKGIYTKVKLILSGASLRFFRMTINYANGKIHSIDVPVTVEDGGSSPEFDLPVERSNIVKADLWYDSRTFNGKKAKVALYAMPE